MVQPFQVWHFRNYILVFRTTLQLYVPMLHYNGFNKGCFVVHYHSFNTFSFVFQIMI